MSQQPARRRGQVQQPQPRRGSVIRQVNQRSGQRARPTAQERRARHGRPIGKGRLARGPQAMRNRRPGVGAYQQGARMRLRQFRQGSLLAVSVTALLLLLWGVDPEAAAQDDAPGPQATAQQRIDDDPDTNEVPEDGMLDNEVLGDPAQAVSQAVETLRDLSLGFYGLFPKLLIAVMLIVIAEMCSRLMSWLLHGLLRNWERTEAIIALTRIGIYLIAVAVGLSIIAGDARALVGSIGLVGLALSWALQTPIESFTGWLLNSFRGYYRVGDRIEVGEVFGDVYRIDVLTTTVWEAGGPGKAVAGAQPTGAMITFPNWEVLRSNLVNYSRDFPYVWDEVTVSVANESDLAYTMSVLRQTATGVVGDQMLAPAAQYQELLAQARLAFDIASEPQVFISLTDSWTDCTVRYLVHARQRRRLSTELLVALTAEMAAQQHHGKIIPAYPRTEVKLRRQWTADDRDDPSSETVTR
jgi:small conductance mechanosensitive channel